MRSDIMGFRQELLVRYGLDLVDALLLSYVQRACVSPKMKKVVDENNQPYVWLQHSKILEDLPILDVKEDMLKKRIHKLVNVGMLKSIIKSDGLIGRRAYYTITETCEELRLSDQVEKIPLASTDQVEKIPLDTPRPSGKNSPSDNTLINNIDNKLIEDKGNGEIPIKTPSHTVSDFIETYNTTCQSLPKCSKVTDKRKRDIQKILKKYTWEEILQVFNNLESSSFCKGDNNRGWKADIDFILREDKFVSVLEGKYNNRTNTVGKRDKFGEFGVVKSIRSKQEDILTDVQF